MENKLFKISIIGLGYVGLPIAMAFGKKFKTIGFDTDEFKIKSFNNRQDPTDQFEERDFKKTKKIHFSSKVEDIFNSDFFIIAVPTPIKKNNLPDLTYIKKACMLVAKSIKKNSTVIFESTVYPGLTEEYCVPILEKISKLKWKKDFYVGYSPERINPGDKIHTLERITKVVSGDSKKTTNKINNLYLHIIKAGTYIAPSIKIAEAAKIIENTQRDINIAFMNELSLIFEKLKIPTYEVLKAAKTKWNFINFKPGLVGGHCIGIDPYYLIYKAKMLKYSPKIIGSGRLINDNMHILLFKKIISLLGGNLKKKITFVGVTFKENCSDLRNSKILELIKKLIQAGYLNIEIYDPLINPSNLDKDIRNYQLKSFDKLSKTDFLFIGSFHDVINKKIGKIKIVNLLRSNSSLLDINWHFYNQFNYSNRKINYLSL